MQKHLQCKKAWPSKLESYLEVNAWTNKWQQDLISEYDQGLAYWTHLGSELLTHKLHIATLAKFDQKLHQSVYLPLTILLALNF